MHDQQQRSFGWSQGAQLFRTHFMRVRSLAVMLFALVGCGSEGGPEAEPTTYYQHVAPLLAEHCVACHQSGGIAPFALDSYAAVKAQADAIRSATSERRMPPWGVTSDGSCGEFADSIALADADIARIADWVEGGLLEGKVATIERPSRPALEDAHVYHTPTFVPKALGGELTEHDEYRCFMLDAGVDVPSFISGYEVIAGAPEIVHHVLFMLVDPAADADDPTLGKNLALMQKLDADSPDREGWECFSGAGDGVNVEATPVVWAPGQGVVSYPEGSGVPLRPEHKVVVQVHYNLLARQGLSDSTQIKLCIVDKVENVGLFLLLDPLLDSLYDDTPDTLEPGKSSVPYHWQVSLRDLGVSDDQQFSLYGVMPHMHELGHKYRMTIAQGAAEASCAADVQQWDFHWQRLYFYQQPITLTPDTTIAVTCDFDTSSRTKPVLPGWGTQNEMCLATLYLTVPISAYAGM